MSYRESCALLPSSRSIDWKSLGRVVDKLNHLPLAVAIGNLKDESSIILCFITSFRSGDWQSRGRVVEVPAAVIGELEDKS